MNKDRDKMLKALMIINLLWTGTLALYTINLTMSWIFDKRPSVDLYIADLQEQIDTLHPDGKENKRQALIESIGE